MFFSPFNALSLLPFEEEQVRILHYCQVTICDRQSAKVYHFLENDVCLIFPQKKPCCFIVLLTWICFPCLIVSLKMFISFLVHMVASSGSCPFMGSCAKVGILEHSWTPIHTETTFWNQSNKAPCRWEAWQMAHQFLFYRQCGGVSSRGNILNKAGIEFWISSIDNCQRESQWFSQ